MRLYLTSAAHPEGSLVVSGQGSGWLNTMGNVKSFLSPTKAGSNTAYTATDNVTTNPAQYMIRRFVAEKFKRDGTFVPGTISYAFARLESAAAANMTFRIIVTIHGTNGVARAIVGTWTSSTEFPTTLTAVTGTLSGGNSIAVVAGEYVSIEFGFAAANSVTTSYTGTLRAGGTDGTDLGSGTTGVTTRSPWFDFPTAGLEELWEEEVDPNQGQAARISSDSHGFQLSGATLPPETSTFTSFIYIDNDRNTYSTFYEPSSGSSAYYSQCSTGSDGLTLGIHQANTGVNMTIPMTVGAWWKFVIIMTPDIVKIRAAPLGTALVEGSVARASGTRSVVSIGWSDAWAGEFIDGRMAGMKFWDSELTVEECEAEFSQYRAVKKVGCIGEYTHFAGASVADTSGAGRPLTSMGTLASASGPSGIPLEVAGPANPDQNNHFLSAA